MAYKFPLEALLKHRSRLEDLARKDYFMAQSEADESMQKIEGYWKAISDARSLRANKESMGGKSVHLLAEVESFISGSKVKIDREQKRLRELLMVVEEKKEILVEAAKEHKIIQKLKEKKAAIYRKKKKAKELKNNDDIVTMRFKRGS